jgi:hypothetical protein
MKTIQPKGEAVSGPSVELVVTRYGNYGDRLSMAAIVNGIDPKFCHAPNILAVVYRGRHVAWVDVPVAAVDCADIESAILASAGYFLGSRCPDMANYPLSFEW